ncbi:MAG: AI-2E family transporter [Candidatus Sungbacteria bacterium]|nr:AI-2E family transporter [Candidatus Sungbacteria bacterium]
MPSKDVQVLQVSTWSIIRFFAVLLGLAALYAIRDILAALFFAVIVASAIEPGIEWLKARRVPRILSVILLYIAIAAGLFFAVYLVFPIVADEFRKFYTALPELQGKIVSEINRLGVFSYISLFGGGTAPNILEIPAKYIGQLGGVFDFVSSVFGGITTFLLTIVFSFYLAAQEKGIENFLRLVAPLQYEPYILDLWKRSQRKLGIWLRTQMLLGALVGILIFFGLTLLGVKQAFFLAIIAALFEIIPVVGPILAAIPAVSIAFLVSPSLGLMVTVLYLVVQQIESHIIVPVVMRRAVDLSPLIVVIALLVGAKLGGIFGILLAVPLTAILAELLNDWDKKKRLLMPG